MESGTAAGYREELFFDHRDPVTVEFLSVNRRNGRAATRNAGVSPERSDARKTCRDGGFV